MKERKSNEMKTLNSGDCAIPRKVLIKSPQLFAFFQVNRLQEIAQLNHIQGVVS